VIDIRKLAIDAISDVARHIFAAERLIVPPESLWADLTLAGFLISHDEVALAEGTDGGPLCVAQTAAWI